jgi:alkanesulfonate monooxygenase SsuD/methylene tetrahydromethanopterin reductase-like flavin-dependent oxidoreductase (luciferase family)
MAGVAGRSLGVMLPADLDPARFARLAEQQGFDLVAAGEHFLFRRPLPNSFVALSAAAAVTSRIRLMTALALAPLYPALVLAKLTSTLDDLSHGRLDLGLGVGGEVPEEFAASGVSLGERGRLLDNAIMRLHEHLDIRRTIEPGLPSMLPKSIQQPTPPIWLGGRSEIAMRRAAKIATGWVPYLLTPVKLSMGVARLIDFSAAHPNRPAPPRVAAIVFVGVGRDVLATEKASIDYLAKLYAMDPGLAKKYVIAGKPDKVADRLTEFYEAGADSVIVHLCAVGDQARRMVRMVAQEVRPHLKDNSMPTRKENIERGGT